MKKKKVKKRVVKREVIKQTTHKFGEWKVPKNVGIKHSCIVGDSK